MTVQQLLEKAKIQKIGKTPVVVLPLDVWQSIEEQLEELEMRFSNPFRKKIAKARAEKKFYSSAEAKKLLKI
ncbi:hypothetical protein COX26_00110 [Candidatus Jorgensenbacteria bacterium CG23_combo_of_CG06-09_8_20_14_all_54_14]|uniref:Prevent-host-death protein n=1 Tax=Candidatus Jorgensenbacteria bacterium CG23_combo_of_CG06-09_8_20_14_all_54_14 TaxID=1974595 RepID=A0A2G9ZAG3_9BACT|nr:MAG: hypothetical protein COX26_00110 [Candidatus Jorgensenbacteria bacterium CG23_combo_of_CG06-09_8_20_14_all_54_14]